MGATKGSVHILGRLGPEFQQVAGPSQAHLGVLRAQRLGRHPVQHEDGALGGQHGSGGAGAGGVLHHGRRAFGAAARNQ